MPVPDYQTLMRPVLDAFANGAINVSEVLPVMAEVFDLSEEDREERIPSGTETLLANRVHWARTYLSKAGLLQSPKRNHHEITERGRAALAQFPDRIDNATLSQFKEFDDWRAPTQDGPQTKASSLLNTGQTPEDLLEQSFANIETALVSDVIEAVLALTPIRFEKLVIDLLLAMGYGGGDLARGRQTRLSNDGGIDGIVNEDELGLDAVYVQAKRYDPSNKIGRPALNAFVGSLTGEGATKGVFVTTSDFSKEARDYVSKVQHRIVLINGERLARLMIKHEVGVRARRTLVVRSVDEDYFSEP